MTFWSPDELAVHTGGRWLRRPAGLISLHGVGIDSRQELAGRAFVAIRGERYDGHDFLADAVEAGARLVVVDSVPRAWLSRCCGPQGRMPDRVGVLLVDDTRAALARLAAAHRRRLSTTTVIAVTGTCGKTTAKGLIDTVLSTSMRGVAAPRSYNNDIGVPLTILGAEPRDAYLIVEIGANRPGEIDGLARIARPDVGVITSVGRAHLAGFGTLETVAREKASMLHHLDPGGLAVVTADAPLLRPHLHHAGPTVRFGLAEDADLRLTRLGSDAGGRWFEVSGSRRFRLGLPGRHNATNALAAVAVARRLGVTDGRISAALGRCRPMPMRMSRHEIDGIVLYNDAYNSNPDSVIASLETFAELAAGAARRVIVLGDMLELGEHAPALHREIGDRLLELDRRLPIARLVLVGELAAYIAEPIRRRWPSKRLTRLEALEPAAATELAASFEPGDAILLKGSRAIGLERLVDALEQSRPAALAATT